MGHPNCRNEAAAEERRAQHAEEQRRANEQHRLAAEAHCAEHVAIGRTLRNFARAAVVYTTPLTRWYEFIMAVVSTGAACLA